MSLDLLNLPSDKESLARVIEYHGYTAESDAKWLWAKWSLYEAYLRGYRRFEAYDTHGGHVDSFVLDKDGKLPLQSQEILIAINKVDGQLRSVNPEPLVTRLADSIGSIRDRANSQVILDAAFNADSSANAHALFVHTLTTLGTAGLFMDTYDDPMLGLGVDLDVVPPYELFPFPVTSRNTRVRAYQRTRAVSLAYLIKKFGDKVKRHVKDMHSYERLIFDAKSDPHDVPNSDPAVGSLRSQHPHNNNVPSLSAKKKVTEIAVKIREVFVYGPNRRLIRYVAASKGYIFQDINYDAEGILAYSPLEVCRFLDGSGFYGASYTDVLFSVTRVAESMLKEVVNNVRDLRRYPITMIPAGVINEKKVFKEGGFDGMRFATFTPEARFALGQQGIKPITIAPHMGSPEQAAQTAKFFHEILDRHSLVRDLAQDKGRLDSLNALQFLDEVSRQPMTVPIGNMQMAYSTVYRAASTDLNRLAAKSDRAVPVNQLSLDLAGAVIDFDDRTVTLTKRAIPDNTRLAFGMRGSSTASPTLKKQEAYLNQERGRIDIVELRLYLIEEGIESAMYLRGDRGAVQRINEDILRLYNDGETLPEQPVMPSPATSRPHIQLIVFDAFLSGVEFQRASVPIREAFYAYREQLQTFSGNVLPGQTPDVQGATLEQEQQAQLRLNA